jgi:hypothetical protein
MKKILFVAALLTGIIFLPACKKKDPQPPTLIINSGSIFLSGDQDASKNSIYKVSVTTKKTDLPLHTLTVYVAYDGGDFAEYYKYTVKESEQHNYATILDIKTRNQPGTEAFKISLADQGGHKSEQTITLTVK